MTSILKNNNAVEETPLNIDEKHESQDSKNDTVHKQNTEGDGGPGVSGKKGRSKDSNRCLTALRY